MTSLIDKVLSQTSEGHMEPSHDDVVHDNINNVLDIETDTDSGIWFWYNSNIKRGQFEEITSNTINQKILMDMLDRYFKEEIGKKNSQFKLLILSLPQQMMDKKGEIENFLLNKFKIKNNKVINLNRCKQGNDEENALYLIPIYDYDFHILQAYHRHVNEKNGTPSDETISQLQSFDSIASVPLSDSEYENSDIDEDSESMEIPKIYSSDNSELLAKTQPNDDEDDYEEEDDDERDAIVLNFTRSSIRNRHVTPSNLYHITSEMSESMSVLSIQSNEYDYDEDEDDTDNTSGMNTGELYRLSENGDNSLSLQYIYPSLSRVTPKNGSLLDINLRVCHILAKDYGQDIMWHAIRQSQGEDWIIYDSEFSMSNLQYCQLDDILTGKPIDGNESENENINDNTENHMMVLFCEVI